MFQGKRPFSAATLFMLSVALLGIIIASTFAGSAQAQQSCGGPSDNALQNHSFESGQANWQFYTNGSASFSVGGSTAAHCDSSAEVTISESGSNVQLYQSGITLQPNAAYRLSFFAKSSTGEDAAFVLQKHGPNYNSYGLNQTANLTTSWQQFSFEFTTSGFSGTATDGRLRIWLAPYDRVGETFWFDQIELTPVDGSNPAPTNTPAPNPTNTPVPGGCDTIAGNVLANPSFESGTSSWSFYTNGSGSVTTSSDANHCSQAAQISINSPGSNVQLYQQGITLQPNTGYRLSFAAKSNSGHDLSITLQNHGAPYNSYGLNNQQFSLSSSWQTFSVEFTTSGFSGTVGNGRLRVWLAPYDAAGDIYWLDNMVLEPTGSAPAPTSTPAPNPTSTPVPPPSGGNQIEIFDWNGNVTTADRGFPRNEPPRENGNWVTPINYAQGTLHLRAEIFSQPVPQSDMRLQFCFWQELNGNNFGLETCSSQENVPGNSGTVRCWSQPIQQMWKLNDQGLEWNRPRFRVAVPIKNGAGNPVSDYNGWNWYGENPSQWYPLNMRFTAIVVAPGSTFSGWGAYGGCS